MPTPGKALLTAGIMPVDPGPFFVSRFLEPRHLTLPDAAASMDLPVAELLDFVERHRPIDSSFAGTLATFTGTTPAFWLNMQAAVDLAKTWEVVH